ncbi:MAG: DMT family transporter [Lachnospiraceae bacterium]|nr:DMT family transporter [Lachnospiraceae bacterium]MDY5701353.1 DMT family transporter [Lachnospiraceae bacterium]
MKKSEVKSSLLLLLTAFIWGVAFVAQSMGLDYVEAMTFNGCRFLLGGTVLLPVIYFRKKRQLKQAPDEGQKRKQRKITLVGGICCGLALCTASCLQQYGIQYTTVGKTGFITALYIVIVPILGIFLKKKISPLVWAGAVLAVAGFYFLCITQNSGINKGDILVFFCAVCFSFHIMIIDYFAPKADGVQLSCVQFYVSGIICMVAAFLLETPSMQEIMAGAIPILYAGIFSCGVAYTLQIVGQARVNPTVASMILSLESVISVLAGWVILQETLTGRQIVGCILVFGAVILAQLPWPIVGKGKTN